MAVGLASRRAGPALTAFDDRLYETLDDMADGGDTVQIAGRELAAILGATERHIRDSEHRLAAAGLIVITKTPNPNEPSIITLLGYPVEGVDKGVTLTTPAPLLTARARAQRPPALAPPTGPAEPATPSRDPDPDCPVCDGSGWVFLPDADNTVEPCRCLTDDYRAWWRAQRRRILNNWPRPKSHDEPPSKADYNATMLEWNRRQLAEAKPPPPTWSRPTDDDDPKF